MNEYLLTDEELEARIQAKIKARETERWLKAKRQQTWKIIKRQEG